MSCSCSSSVSSFPNFHSLFFALLIKSLKLCFKFNPSLTLTIKSSISLCPFLSLLGLEIFQMERGSASGSASTLSNNENVLVSCEDSSSPAENELELGLTLSLGRERRVSYADDSSSSSSSLSSRASVTAGIKRTADSMAATSG